MTKMLMPLTFCALVFAQTAFGDDLLPTPPSSSPPSATPTPATPPAAQSPAPGPGPQPSSQALAEARAACDPDIQKLCPTVQPGGGRILACLKQHKDQVSDGCKQAVVRVMQRNN